MWKRDDGYISCTAGDHVKDGKPGFTMLFESEEWPEAREVLVQERLNDHDHYDLVALWCLTDGNLLRQALREREGL